MILNNRLQYQNKIINQSNQLYKKEHLPKKKKSKQIKRKLSKQHNVKLYI